MNRLDIKQKLERLGYSAYSIARDMGVEAPAVYGVLKGTTTSKRIESKLEDILGIPIEEIQQAYRIKHTPASAA